MSLSCPDCGNDDDDWFGADVFIDGDTYVCRCGAEVVVDVDTSEDCPCGAEDCDHDGEATLRVLNPEPR